MNTIPAQEIKRRGISAVDDALKSGDVHIIKNNKPLYVILSEERYCKLISASETALFNRVKTSLKDLSQKKTRRHKNVEALIREFDLES